MLCDHMIVAALLMDSNEKCSAKISASDHEYCLSSLCLGNAMEFDHLTQSACCLFSLCINWAEHYQ